MSKEDGKLIATALGAATAGAALAVIAMKMIESSKDGNSNNSYSDNNSSNKNNNNNNKNESSNNLLAYHKDDTRPIRTSLIMNDPSDLVGDDGGHLPANTIQRESSDAVLFPHNHEAKMRRRIATRYTIEEENNLGRDSVTVRVPATSANVGPGCKWLYFVIYLFIYSFYGTVTFILDAQSLVFSFSLLFRFMFPLT